MSRIHLLSSVVVAALAIAGWTAPAYAAAAKAMPIFEVDKGWPQKPANMKFGDVSSIAIDDKDNAWVLTRPRTLKPADKAQAAPPVTIFDASGKYVRGWGGDGPGYQWPEREHGILFDSKGNPHALAVPKSAVVTSTERKYVIVVRDGRTVRVDVTTGNESNDRIEILGNIRSGESVIANANDEITEGKIVK